MSNLTTIVNNIISKVNTHTTDLSNKTTQLSTHISGIASYHLLQGNLAVSASTITQGFNTTLYTGNGGTQSINTGIDMSTQWGNDASETFGGLVWQKYRSVVGDNTLIDSIRGAGKYISSNTTGIQGTDNNSLSSFTSNGFNVGTSWSGNGATAASWNFQTTHRVTGTTNHGKDYTCHYNPFTGFTMVKYTGSGLAGHEIPHMLGRKLDFSIVKNLTIVQPWLALVSDANAHQSINSYICGSETKFVAMHMEQTSALAAYGMDGQQNNASNTYIMYGWANSYFDESNKLIGNYEIGVYQGTGTSGNKVTTRGKPAWVMIKRLDASSNWTIADNKRLSPAGQIFANSSSAEVGDISNFVYLEADGLNIRQGNSDTNTSGGQYLYMVAYDTNANGGGTYYPLASDTANVQVNNALIPIAQGIDSNGAKNTILSKNETFSGVTYTQGKNYPYYDALGNRGVSVHKPRYLESELVRTYAGESPDYFNVKENKWYSTNSGSEMNANSAIQTNDIASWTVSANGSLTWSKGIYSMARSVLNNNVTFTKTFTGLTAGVTYIFVLNTSRTGNAWYVSLDGGTTIYATITDGICYIKITPTTTSVAFTIMQSNVNTVGVTLYVNSLSIYNQIITPTTEITNGRNYLNHIVYADNDGGVLYVEELPKIEYKDIVKANEFKGKNACTAYVVYDDTTTPPTIKESINIASIIKVSTTQVDIYFKEDMDTDTYSIIENTGNQGALSGTPYTTHKPFNIGKKKFSIYHYASDVGGYSNTYNSIQVIGGKN